MNQSFTVLIFSMIISLTVSATHAKNHQAFKKTWTPTQQKELKDSPSGSYCIIEDDDEEGTYKLILNHAGTLYSKEFRHDRDYVTREVNNQWTFVNLYVKDVEDFFSGPE